LAKPKWSMAQSDMAVAKRMREEGYGHCECNEANGP